LKKRYYVVIGRLKLLNLPTKLLKLLTAVPAEKKIKIATGHCALHVYLKLLEDFASICHWINKPYLYLLSN